MTRQKSRRTRQKNKTGGWKRESNDSPEIPDRGKGRKSDTPGLDSGRESKDARALRMK